MNEVVETDKIFVSLYLGTKFISVYIRHDSHNKFENEWFIRFDSMACQYFDWQIVLLYSISYFRIEVPIWNFSHSHVWIWCFSIRLFSPWFYCFSLNWTKYRNLWPMQKNKLHEWFKISNEMLFEAEKSFYWKDGSIISFCARVQRINSRFYAVRNKNLCTRTKKQKKVLIFIACAADSCL